MQFTVKIALLMGSVNAIRFSRFHCDNSNLGIFLFHFIYQISTQTPGKWSDTNLQKHMGWAIVWIVELTNFPSFRQYGHVTLHNMFGDLLILLTGKKSFKLKFWQEKFICALRSFFSKRRKAQINFLGSQNFSVELNFFYTNAIMLKKLYDELVKFYVKIYVCYVVIL